MCHVDYTKFTGRSCGFSIPISYTTIAELLSLSLSLSVSLFSNVTAVTVQQVPVPHIS